MKLSKEIILSLLVVGVFGATLSVHAATPAKEDVSVSVKKAITTFQSEYPDTDITSLELDSTLGKYYYEIEGRDDSVEYTAKIDAKSKKISNKEKERLDAEDKGDDNKASEKLDTQGIIGVTKAAELARKEVEKGKAMAWKLDKELGTTYWEVTVKNKNKITEVMIGAKKGNVLSTESED